MNAQDELASLIGRHVAKDGINPTPIPRLKLIQGSRPTEPRHALHEPALCIVARGKKRVLLGEEAYLYGPERYLIVSVDLPVAAQVLATNPDDPYLCFRLALDAAMSREFREHDRARHRAAARTPRSTGDLARRPGCGQDRRRGDPALPLRRQHRHGPACHRRPRDRRAAHRIGRRRSVFAQIINRRG